MNKIIHLIIISVLLLNYRVFAEDLRKIVPLAGIWKFSIGDDKAWAKPSYDDSSWDRIQVPGSWENQGYDDYNGYAWYRKKFKTEEIPTNEMIYLLLGKIDDIDEVYLNGKRIGVSGNFPPEYETAYSKIRRYTVPQGTLKPNSVNVIAVRVYDEYGWGGITEGSVGFYVSADIEYLDFDLSGKWKFHIGENKEWKKREFNDNDWKEITVPSEWESEGYEGYDGYAWYRKQFRLPEGFKTENIYLSLGKIDDIDDVYLNGVKIGCVYDLDKDREYRWNGSECNARRLYKIPEEVLVKNGTNLISVRVYDGQIRGGIYEGPVGIMSNENYKKYKNKYGSYQSFWDFLYNEFVVNEW